MPAPRTRRAAALCLAAGLALVLAARPAPAQPVAGLRQYRWERRVVALFAPASGAPAADSAAYAAQRRELARSAELLGERDVIVLHFPPDADPARAAELRRQLRVPGPGFAVVLVGKDGGVKLRRRTLLTADRLASTIDAMPMGAAEARRRRPGA
jgi:hypothetical protein